MFQTDLIFSLVHFMYPKLSLFVGFHWLQTRPHKAGPAGTKPDDQLLTWLMCSGGAETWGRMVSQERQLEVTVPRASADAGVWECASV